MPAAPKKLPLFLPGAEATNAPEPNAPEPTNTPEPACEPGEVSLQLTQCRVASCNAGRFETRGDSLVDCERPLKTEIRFAANDAALSLKALGSLENLAVMAEALGVKELTVAGHQNWDEKPASTAALPLSRARANATRDALATVTQIPIEIVDDGPPHGRYAAGAEFLHNAQVSMAPLDEVQRNRELPPIKLPWARCESKVTFTAEISISTTDGQILTELCRNGACSRTNIPAFDLAQWPGSLSASMTGDFAGLLSMEQTKAQLARNRLLAYGEGTGPTSFELEVALEDERISASDTFRLRLLRNRKDLALDWSGKLEFASVRRHATRDVPPCLIATRAISRSEHELR